MSGVVPPAQQGFLRDVSDFLADGKEISQAAWNLLLALWNRTGMGPGVNSCNSDVSAAGTTTGTATELNTVVSQVTSATGGSATGVRLLISQPGDQQWVFNTSGATISVYPTTGATMDGSALPYSLATDKAQIFTVVAEDDIRSFQIG